MTKESRRPQNRESSPGQRGFRMQPANSSQASLHLSEVCEFPWIHRLTLFQAHTEIGPRCLNPKWEDQWQEVKNPRKQTSEARRERTGNVRRRNRDEPVADDPATGSMKAGTCLSLRIPAFIMEGSLEIMHMSTGTMWDPPCKPQPFSFEMGSCSVTRLECSGVISAHGQGLSLSLRLQCSGTIVAHCSLDLLDSRDPPTLAS
ncbi:Protein PPP5D1 [Plecturocebus cupreus]